QRGASEARLAADEHEPDVALRALDQVAVRVLGAILDDEDVGLEPRPEAAGAAFPAERVCGIRGHHLAELTIRERAIEVLPVPEVGDLELAEHVLRAGRPPGRAEAHADAGRVRTGAVGRRPVAPEVRAGRPAERPRMRRP